MTGWPAQPVIYEVNTAIWLDGLTRVSRRPVTLIDVTADDWAAVTPAGVDAVWMMGGVGTKPGRASPGRRQYRAAGLVPGSTTRPAARRHAGLALLRTALRRRPGLRRPGRAGHGPGRVGRPGGAPWQFHLVLRRERQAPWASPVFPFLGWIILGWILTWAAVELHMLQRLLDTTSLSGGQWAVVIGLSLLAPAVVGIDKAIQLSRQRSRMSGTEA